jgi:hypothetical protein
MSWKQINGRSYYYRSVREGGQVRSEYYGGGEAAYLIAQIHALDREERDAQRQAERLEREQAGAEDRDFMEWFNQVEAVAHAALDAAGYHRHHRGEWRKRRVRREQDDRQANSPRDPGGDEGPVPPGRAGG